MNKKSFICFCIGLLLFATGCSKIGEESEIEEKSVIASNYDVVKDVEEIKDVEETIERETIVIDPGHSSVGNSQKEPIAPNSQKTKAKDVLGATGNYSNVPEYQTNMSISLELRDELESRGYNVVMTKQSTDKSLSNIERASIGNENNADLVIRIHADSSQDNGVNGASALVPQYNQYTNKIVEPSEIYGEKIINTYTKRLNIKNRGVIHRDDMTGFNWSKVPVVILEMGFLSNKSDDTFISDVSNHSKIAKAIADGIDTCFK